MFNRCSPKMPNYFEYRPISKGVRWARSGISQQKEALLERGLVYVNQHDEDYLMQTASSLAVQRLYIILSNYFDHLFLFRFRFISIVARGLKITGCCISHCHLKVLSLAQFSSLCMYLYAFLLPKTVCCSELTGHSLRSFPVCRPFQVQSIERLCSILPDFNWQHARAVPQRQLGFLYAWMSLRI